MTTPKLVIAIALEPDLSRVETGQVEAYRVNIPTLNFNELAQFLEQEVHSEDKVSVRFANDYIDIATLHLAHAMLEEISYFCAQSVGSDSAKLSRNNEIDIRDQWSEYMPVEDRAIAPPPGIVFFTVEGNSIPTVGIWLTVLYDAFGHDWRSESQKKPPKNTPMQPHVKQRLESFFGLPFLPTASVTNLGPAG
jgi:hypothetical protein